MRKFFPSLFAVFRQLGVDTSLDEAHAVPS
jgi:hypothetical protein